MPPVKSEESFGANPAGTRPHPLIGFTGRVARSFYYAREDELGVSQPRLAGHPRGAVRARREHA